MIARCSQPEISWWGWRNTDDEYLVTSIAKACQMDGGAKFACGAPAFQQRGEAPDSSDSDFGKAVNLSYVQYVDLMHALLDIEALKNALRLSLVIYENFEKMCFIYTNVSLLYSDLQS